MLGRQVTKGREGTTSAAAGQLAGSLNVKSYSGSLVDHKRRQVLIQLREHRRTELTSDQPLHGKVIYCVDMKQDIVRRTSS
jgi:hypothetical protein